MRYPKKVEVVRCEDCKHRPCLVPIPDGHGLMQFVVKGAGNFICPFEYMSGETYYPEESFFCKNGERREEV